MTVFPVPLFLPSLGPLEIALLFVVVLILFGPGKLPQVFGALGEGVQQFKKASKDVTDSIETSATNAPPPAPPASPTSSEDNEDKAPTLKKGA